MKTNVLAELRSDGYLYLVFSDGHQKQFAYAFGKAELNGIPLLNASGVIDAGFMPYTALKYKGVLDASGAAYPTSPVSGDTWVISVAGTISGTVYTVGDMAIYNGSDWDKIEGDTTAVEIVALLDAANYNTGSVFPLYTAAADIADDLIARPDGSSGVIVGTEDCLIAGVNNTGATIASAGTGILSKGKCTVKAGEDDLAGGIEIVCGPAGKVVDYKSALVPLMSAVQGAADDDFTIGVLSGAEKIKLVSSEAADTMNIDVYGYTGSVVTKETIALTGVSGVETIKADWDEILAVYVSSNMAGNLTISDPSDNAIKVLTTPTQGWYGAIATDDSDDADGHLVYVDPTGANTGKVALLGTDGDDAVKYELMTMGGAGVDVYNTEGFKTITHLLIGADDIATETYAISIAANARPRGFTLAAIVAGAVGNAVLY